MKKKVFYWLTFYFLVAVLIIFTCKCVSKEFFAFASNNASDNTAQVEENDTNKLTHGQASAMFGKVREKKENPETSLSLTEKMHEGYDIESRYAIFFGIAFVAIMFYLFAQQIVENHLYLRKEENNNSNLHCAEDKNTNH